VRQQARGALHDLIGKVADGSNLTLDPNLDSFYVMDAATGKIPEAVDRIYGLGATTSRYAGRADLTPEEQAGFLVQEGGLTPVLDGLGASLDIAAAVEQQNATTQEIAASVQAVSNATASTAQAMEHVVSVADDAGTASRDVLAGSAEIGREAETLRTEVDQFLAAVRYDPTAGLTRRAA
jgi:methyl-accepting chemotaxis protein